MDYSLPAWLGALAGTIIAVGLYVVLIGRIEAHLRAQAPARTREERTTLDDRLSVTRRLILGADIAVMAALGYWLGKIAAGKWAADGRMRG